jgi:coenzyme F420 hydrogenase subunit beta
MSIDLEKNALEKIVSNNLCVGCGMCAGILPRSLRMCSDKYGAYFPELIENPDNGWEQMSLQVCPFANIGENEDSIGKRLFGAQDGVQHRLEMGYYLQCFTGYLTDDRDRVASTSGGIITWLAGEMLSSGKVDAVACVSRSDKPENLFEYQLVRDPSDLSKCKKSRYYPVEMSRIIKEIKDLNGKVLFIGLPCFIKAMRLAVKVDLILKDRIECMVGLFCGHLKTKHYSAYLARSAGVHERDIKTVEFRKKIQGMPANRYAFEVVTRNEDSNDRRQIMMQDVWAGSWSNNLFMLDACEYCDDIMSETADISVGDAWLPEHIKDYRGKSIIVCRNKALLPVLEAGVNKKEIALEEIQAEDVIKSQAGGIRQRRAGLQYRLYLSAKKRLWRPTKRVAADAKAGDFLFRLLQLLRIKTKTLSKQAFLEQQSIDGIDVFVRKLRPWIMLSVVINFSRHMPGIIQRRLSNLLSRFRV